MENIVVLTPLEELTQDISLSTAPAAYAIPTIMALTCLLERRAGTDHSVQTAKLTLLEAVKRRFSNMELEPLNVLATILDLW